MADFRVSLRGLLLMPWENNPAINSLRARFNVAVAAHQASAQALRDASQGAAPSPDLVEAEAKARLRLEEARGKLLAAITSAITGVDAPEPPSSQT